MSSAKTLPLALSAIILASMPCSAAPPAPPKLELTPYSFTLRDGTKLDAERGTFSVPEDRNDPGSRRIALGFVRFKSTSPRPGNPIVYLAGGPGGSGIGAAREQRQPIFLKLREVADVIAFDQRGVGLSNHFPRCTADKALDAALPLTEEVLTQHSRAALLKCVAQWQAGGIAVKGYTTEQNADDLEDLRRALGAGKIDLWGISYGSHLAFAAMRRHPGSIGRVALASAEGMDQTVKLPAHVDAVYGRIEKAIGLEEGALTGPMRRVLDRHSEPRPFTLGLPDGSSMTYRVGAFPLRMAAGILPKNPDGIAQLYGLFSALDAGRTQPIAPLLYGYFYKDPLVVHGMPELMDIASGISPRRLAIVRRQAPASLSGTATNFPMPQLRGAIPGLELKSSYRREISSDIPTLLFSGDLDVRTPLEGQAVAVAGLRNLHQVIVRNGGHDLFEAHPDVPQMLVDFFSGRPLTVRELQLPAPRLAP